MTNSSPRSTQRETAGETLDNRLMRIEQVELHSASLDGRMARIAVRFTADIASVTRDKDGHVVAGFARRCARKL